MREKKWVFRTPQIVELYLVKNSINPNKKVARNFLSCSLLCFHFIISFEDLFVSRWAMSQLNLNRLFFFRFRRGYSLLEEKWGPPRDRTRSCPMIWARWVRRFTARCAPKACRRRIYAGSMGPAPGVSGGQVAISQTSWQKWNIFSPETSTQSPTTRARGQSRPKSIRDRCYLQKRAYIKYIQNYARLSWKLSLFLRPVNKTLFFCLVYLSHSYHSYFLIWRTVMFTPWEPLAQGHR